MPDTLPPQLDAELARQYDIMRVLGRGGMGTVWLARERSLDRLVAIKVLSGELVDAPAVRERFRREARIAAKLAHPHIVPLHAFGETPDALYFVMGYVDGETLAARLDREGRLPKQDAARILGEVSDALAFAHREGVVHRDVKPENILLERRSGRALLADFGVAHVEAPGTAVTQTGIAVGTPSYMSPEQALGAEIDGRSDLYSLGVVGYRMLAGRLPFAAASGQALMAQHAAHRPGDLAALVAPDSQAVARVLMRALEKEPRDRWARGEEMRAELETAARTEAALPPALQEIQGLGNKMLVATAAVGLVYGSGMMWNERWFTSPDTTIPIVLSSVLFPAIAAVVAAVKARKHGWRDTLTAMFHKPGGWRHWWPRALRRGGDIWDRLPRPLRRLRNAIDGVVAFFVIDTMLLINMATTGAGVYGDWVLSVLQRSQPDWLPPAIFAVPRFAMLGWVAYEYWRTKRLLKVSLSEVNELLRAPHSATDSAWAKPRFARLLTPQSADARAIAPATPRTPDELVRAIVELSGRLAQGGLLPGDESATAARSVKEAIDALDDDIRRLASEIDPAELDRVDRRLANIGHDADMRRLLESQRELWQRLQARLGEKQLRRERLRDQLVTLWMQLFELDARITRGVPASPELTAEVRSLLGAIGDAGAALTEVERLVAPREATPV